jgi:hypothetical protein
MPILWSEEGSEIRFWYLVKKIKTVHQKQKINSQTINRMAVDLLLDYNGEKKRKDRWCSYPKLWYCFQGA